MARAHISWHFMKIATDTKKIAYLKETPADLKLSARRPDLWNIQITQANIDNEAPFLETVNKLLFEYLGGLTPKIDWATIANGTKSFIPHNPNLPTIQTALQTNGVSLKDIAACFSKSDDDTPWQLAQLNMAGSDLSVLAVELAANSDWNVDKIKFPKHLKIVAGLDDDALYRLIYNDIAVAERDGKLNSTYINRSNNEKYVSYTKNNEPFTNLNEDTLKRIQVFVTLAVKLRWDYVVLNQVLLKLNFSSTPNSTEIGQLAKLAFLSEKWKLAPDVLAEKISVLSSFEANSQGYLSLITAAASGLSVPSYLLRQFIPAKSSFTTVLVELVLLQRKAELLEKTSIKLTDYLSILALTKTDVSSNESIKASFNKWHEVTETKLKATENGLESPSGNDLQKVLFQQWLHEFCVYSGAQETDVRGLLLGIFGTDETGSGDGFTRLNTFFRKQNVPAQIIAKQDVPVPDVPDPDEQLKFFTNLLPYVFLVQKLQLDTPSIQFLGQYLVPTLPDLKPNNRANSMITGIDLLTEDLADTFAHYAYSYAQIPEEKNKPAFIAELQGEFDINKFPPIMGWPDDSIEHLYKTLNVTSSTESTNIALLYQLCDCYSYAQTTGITADNLLNYINTISSDSYAALSPVPAATASNEYRDALGKELEQNRDRIVPVALWNLYQNYPDINSPDHLSDYFLCDVEMGGVMDIAPIREATDAVQTYLMRCKGGLEQVDLDELKTITEEKWQWIPNFRIWQAEQMLRTYPENYLQPTVRSTQSDLFISMINDLQGNDQTESSVETAMLNYLDDWADLSSAQLVDASAYKVYSEYFGKEVETIFFITQSRVKENTFNFNFRETDPVTENTRWSEWKEIPVTINADTVSAAYAFNRLHVFWAEESSVTDADPTIANTKYTSYTRTIKCTYENLNGTWSTPKTITSFVYKVDLATGSKLIEPKPAFVPDKKIGINLITDGESTKQELLQLFFDINSERQNITSPLVLHADAAQNQSLVDYVTNINRLDKSSLYPCDGITTSSPLVVYKDQIYFSDSVNQLCFVDNHGGNRQNVGEIETSERVVFYNQKLYFKKKQHTEIYKADINGTNVEKTGVDDCNGSFYVANNSIYYFTTKNELLEMNLSTQFTINIYSKDHTPHKSTDLLVIGDFLYYTGQDKKNVSHLLKCNLEDNYKVSEIDICDSCSRLAAYNGQLFFTYANDLFKIDVPSISNLKLPVGSVLSGDQSHLSVFNNSLYFFNKYYQPIRYDLKNSSYNILNEFEKSPTTRYMIPCNDWLFVCDKGENARKYDIPNSRPFNPLVLDNNLVQLPGNQDCWIERPTASKERLNPVLYTNTDKSGPGLNIGCRDLINFIQDNYKSTCQIRYKASFYDDYKLFENQITRPVNNFFSVRNRVGAFVFDLGYASYLFTVKAELDSLTTISLTDSVVKSSADMQIFNDLKYRAERIASTVPGELRTLAHKNRIQFMSEKTEGDEFGVVKTKFSDLKPSGKHVKNPVENSDNKIDFNGSFGIYAREFYFHGPMAVANLLSQNFQEDDARKWYHIVYNSLGVKTTENQKEVWKYLPFKENKTTTISDTSTVFDPDLIAENDLIPYKHWTIVQYINFILDFGDNEFRQETWESLSLATQLYFEAEDLLGQEPVVLDKVTDYEKNAANRTISKGIITFGIPTNVQLQALWDRVKDRLYKLRNGLNINGEKQMPSMYGTAIDPNRLELAAQNGGINPYDDSSLTASIPLYRFRELAPHTESLINTVVEFGGQLHGALQQKDNEQLQALQATHQVNMLNVVSNLYQYQIDEANKEADALNENLVLVEEQVSYYSRLIEKGWILEEKASLKANGSAMVLQLQSAGIRVAAIEAQLLPTIFGLADGGFKPGDSVEAAAAIQNERGAASQTMSQILATRAEFARRSEEWNFELEQANQNKEQLQGNIEAANIRVKIAKENMRQYQLQVTQANEVMSYLNTKFTNAELYTWMSGQMASLYFTAYHLALGSLHKLQAAYAYELDIDNINFIPSGAWNSLRKGLLAGETLKLALANIQDAYMNNNKRKQEVEKLISLKTLASTNNWEKVTFNLTDKELAMVGKKLKIKSIAVSIPAVIGPYETFDATLKHVQSGQYITISRGIDDMGIFQEDMNDGRYLPFEGIKIPAAGDDGKWAFACEKYSFQISDVILSIKFWILDK